jgi:hypothetical protein
MYCHTSVRPFEQPLLIIACPPPSPPSQRRYRIDVAINSSQVRVWRPHPRPTASNPHPSPSSSGRVLSSSPHGTWSLVAWKEVVAGDIVQVLNEQHFPADVLLLQSSSRQGMCNIETSNLDGETNLKIKQAVAQTYELAHSALPTPSHPRPHPHPSNALNSVDASESSGGLTYPTLFHAVLESEAPKETMDASSWKGNLVGLQGAADKIPLGMTQMLLRVCAVLCRAVPLRSVCSIVLSLICTLNAVWCRAVV